jgi:osmotically-inducible protein OsmY
LPLTSKQMAARRGMMMRMAGVSSVNRMMGVAVAIMMLLAACSSMTGKTLGENIDDAGITAKVKAKLAGEKISTVTRIDVDTNQGVVALNGTVASEAMRVRAAEIARDVKGVRDVVNNLKVQTS